MSSLALIAAGAGAGSEVAAAVIGGHGELFVQQFAGEDPALWQHRWTHTVPALWRLHRVHHADPELDATTGLRFHPLEILLSMGLKMAAVAALISRASGVEPYFAFSADRIMSGFGLPT